jgi:hypothetical protein
MRELRVWSGGNPLRIFHAFDPRRTAIPRNGGDNTGKDRFDKEYIPVADALHDAHLDQLFAASHAPMAADLQWPPAPIRTPAPLPPSPVRAR